MCDRRVFCLNCNWRLTLSGNEDHTRKKESLLAAHDCDLPNSFCKPCGKPHDTDQNYCKMKIPKLKTNFPKIGFLSMAYTDPNNLSCVMCQIAGCICPTHEYILGEKEPCISYLILLHEVKNIYKSAFMANSGEFCIETQFIIQNCCFIFRAKKNMEYLWRKSMQTIILQLKGSKMK